MSSAPVIWTLRASAHRNRSWAANVAGTVRQSLRSAAAKRDLVSWLAGEVRGLGDLDLIPGQVATSSALLAEERDYDRVSMTRVRDPLDRYVSSVR